MHSAQSSVTGTARSTASQRRLLEARAAREKAELEMKRLEEERKRLEEEHKLREQRINVQRELIEARLTEELALLDEDDKSSRASARSRVQEWVDKTGGKSSHHDRDAPQSMLQDKPDTNIASLAVAIAEAIKLIGQPTTNSDKLIARMSARDLPTFSGDPIDWLRFKSAFENTTAIGQYTEEENIARLQRCLIGEAWEAVAARLIATRSSAVDIMKTLEMRFGRPELVVHVLVENMKRLPKLSGLRSDLITLATKVSNCVAAIEATEKFEYLHSPELVTEVINKLTEPLVYRWLDYCATSDKLEARLCTLARYLMLEAEKVCKAGAVELPHMPVARFVPSKRPVLTTTEKGSFINAVVMATCIYCGKTDHAIDNCSDYRKHDINKRWEWACEKKLCFACLQSTHRRDRCRPKKRCGICNRGHHTLLHRSDWQTDRDNDQDELGRFHTMANVWGQTGKKVYLKVLPVTVEGPAGSLKTFALLDEGSTVTLIERNVAKVIGAEGPKTDLNLHGAVGDCLRTPSHRVSLTLRTLEGTHTLDNVRTVDNLTLPTQNLNHSDLSSLSHLKDLPLETYKGKPTMIIGQDYWYLIISRQVSEGRKNEPVASLTRLGWVLHGFAAGRHSNADYSCHLHEPMVANLLPARLSLHERQRWNKYDERGDVGIGD